MNEITLKMCFDKYIKTIYTLIIIIILLIIAIALILYFFIPRAITVNNFKYKLPKEMYPILVSELGKPDSVLNVEGGHAIWTSKDYLLNITLKDEIIQHLKPDQHCDFLYVTIIVFIPDSTLIKVLELSDNLTYDRQKKQLTVRCNSLGWDIGTLYLAVKIATDVANAESYKSKFSETLLSTSNGDTYKKLYDELSDLIKKANTMPITTPGAPDQTGINVLLNVDCKCVC